MKKTKYYISGRMTDGGSKEHSFDPFFKAEERLKKLGYEVFNPAALEEGERSWEYYMARDLLWIVENKPTMYFLLGWEKGKGTILEHEMAKLMKLDIEYEKLLEH